MPRSTAVPAAGALSSNSPRPTWSGPRTRWSRRSPRPATLARIQQVHDPFGFQTARGSKSERIMKAGKTVSGSRSRGGAGGSADGAAGLGGRAARVGADHQARLVHRLERAGGDLLEQRDQRVRPLRVRGALEEPVAPVV